MFILPILYRPAPPSTLRISPLWALISKKNESGLQCFTADAVGEPVLTFPPGEGSGDRDAGEALNFNLTTFPPVQTDLRDPG
ncbi:MAG: hypothetical protein NTZ74_01930 [Chloroflexi bacterium]|nr:hypothetical protein [Chloroflexota bacterium]